MTPAPEDQGNLEYGSILPNGDDWRLRKFDVGMGEREYRIFKNEKFFAMFDSRADADVVMVKMTTSASSDKVLEQCETCYFKGTRACHNHGYPSDTIPKSCAYKVGVDAQFALNNLAGTFIIKNLRQQTKEHP